MRGSCRARPRRPHQPPRTRTPVRPHLDRVGRHRRRSRRRNRRPAAVLLLREAEDSHTGEIYLEASADAVNALVGGLDIPIEDQQAALETVLERQLARGELDAAHATAIKARQLTAGYLIQIEELLREN